MQTLPRLFCRFRRFWFSQKSARLLFFLLQGSEILRQNAAKRCVATVGKAKKSGSSGKSCVCCASQKKQDKPLALDAKCRLWAIDAATVCPPPPSDLWHFQSATSSPYRVYRPPLFLHLFLCILHPVLHLKLSEKHRKSKALVQEMQDFFWIFFEGGRKGRKPEIENIGLLCIKHPYFHAKTSALYIIEVRCFWFPGNRFLEWDVLYFLNRMDCVS